MENQQSNIDQILLHLKNLLQKLGESEPQITHHLSDDIHLKISATTPTILPHIQNQTLTIQSLQTLLRNLTPLNSPLRLNLDLNNFKQKQEQEIIALADNTASTVSILGESQTLPPMSPYFRHLIHDHLKNNPHIKTISTGDPHQRQITLHYQK